MLALNNKVNYLKKSLAAELLKLFFDDELHEKINMIPIERVPKFSQPIDCCIFKDRAMIRNKIMALLGINIEEEEDETKDLSFFLEKALNRKSVDCPVLTVIDIACHSCEKEEYYVTDLCQGCSARPCESNCPIGAIKVINGRAVIDQTKCVKCGRCKDMCPYNAIVYKPVPCESNCPVDAISRDPDTGKAKIDYDKCIYCGKCTKSCPFGAIMDRSQIIDVAKNLKNGKNVIALVAPSIVGQFPGTILQTLSALKKIGFSKVYEVAYGADLTAKNEAEELIEKVGSGNQSMLCNSCCPAWVETAKKHVPELLKFVSNTPTPMAFTARMAKKDEPSSITVFIGPCISKKFEAIHNSDVDYVLTFEELGAFFMANGIEISELPENEFDSPFSTTAGRKFPISGGVTEAVEYYVNEINNDNSLKVRALKVDGLNKKNISMLKRIVKNENNFNFLEVMACENGCVGGPGVISNPKLTREKIKTYSTSKLKNEEMNY